MESIRIREPRKTALPRSSKSQGSSGGVSFQVVCGQSSHPAHIRSDSGSFLGAHASLSQDRTGRLAEHIMGYFLLVLFGPSQILPVGFVGGSSVLCSLLGPHVVRHLIQVPSRQFWSTVP